MRDEHSFTSRSRASRSTAPAPSEPASVPMISETHIWTGSGNSISGDSPSATVIRSAKPAQDTVALTTLVVDTLLRGAGTPHPNRL
ncbi:hypothetical protein ACIQPP_46445 [Streptomyces violaceusniger]|uniref:hypothetical protein n=1 Tax=Streptomyces violaceusniger TaxID=68280 RepID=UPI0009968B98|nr:hypothetical protein [Streptomyces hygroscopicus]AQW46553.1 TetR family transcriptional regulator [Streptomyces hygroscopicus]